MSMNCEYCGKELGDEPKFPLEGEGEICEACYISWQKENECRRYDSQIDAGIRDILEHKEDYRDEKLEEALAWLNNYGYVDEAAELKRYMRKVKKKRYEEMGNVICDEDNVYQGSETTIWTSIIEFCCILYMAILTVIGLVCGIGIAQSGEFVILGPLLGAGIGFLIGAFGAAFLMSFVVLCKNISIIADNSAQTLMKLDKIIRKRSRSNKL